MPLANLYPNADQQTRGAQVSLSHVSKSYPSGRGERVVVLQDFSIAVPPSTCLSIVGPNGCGKTTLLHIAAGILPPDEGEVSLQTGDPAPPTISMVFQDYRAALFPWMSVGHNIAFPLLVRGVPRAEALSRAREVLEAAELELPLERHPHELSGGQQQLVCLARALVIQPHVLIMDEPFGALDYETRLRMHEVVEAMLLAAGCTVLFVSHEVDEAVLMADEVIVLTRRPATVLGRHRVDIPKPRGPAIFFDETFLRCRSAVLRDLRSAISGEGR